MPKVAKPAEATPDQSASFLETFDEPVKPPRMTFDQVAKAVNAMLIEVVQGQGRDFAFARAAAVMAQRRLARDWTDTVKRARATAHAAERDAA